MRSAHPSLMSRVATLLMLPILLMSAACHSRESPHAPAHTLITYQFKAGGRPAVIRVWSYLKVKVGMNFVHQKVEAPEGSILRFETGQTMRLQGGKVILDGVDVGDVLGNLILSKDGIKKGFIRTFD